MIVELACGRLINGSVNNGNVDAQANAKGVLLMKEGIHPTYYEAEVVCSCGNRFNTGSTKKEIKVEGCSQFHPIYTDTNLLKVESGGRVDKFRKKYGL